MSVIECRNLTKTYRQFHALNDLSMEIRENTITGLIGRNGAGKTTLLKIIAGFLRSTSGEVMVFGQKPFNSLTVSANMIFIDENLVFPAAFCLEEILKEAGKFYQNWDQELAFNLLEYYNLNPKISHQHLSKGTKSIFNTIIGLAARCPLTILDEPTTGMDSVARKDFYRALLKDYMEVPRTIIFSSHQLNEVENLLEDILLIKYGRKCLHIPVLELKEYAVALQGDSAEINGFILEDDVLHRENFAKDQAYLIVRNHLSETRLAEMKLAGIEIAPVSAEDACNYLTMYHNGGIDDVYRKN
ncbi:ABC transporter related protein [Syntrophobotulus glycolicus DSM 8271]|uniref:ABC transporter related protein n=1 Tax=Syntrophobotulus glycolicus (strain DSM 8271 / FlGlyR) TaxID=645991 RepID=F0SZ08_SYNGF|nr:ABC transporter ATP-binding protein [Syntrophobotulus glycolicus]ADY56045.1 ABC transporter related protein [Syntrophobotulus glycolicus DSM 8271]